jgi:hypothetical protein
MLLSIHQSEREALLALYNPRVEAIVTNSAGLSARILLDRITPMVADLAVDILAREYPVVASLSKTKAKAHLNRAQLAVVDLILPEKTPAGQEGDRHGIFENLSLGDAWGLIRVPSYRRRLRATLLAGLREKMKRMMQECASEGHCC